MKKGFLITLSKTGITNKERAAYLNSLEKTIVKFNNELGFKPVSLYRENPHISSRVPKDFVPPMSMIFKKFIVEYQDNKIASYFIPFGFQNCDKFNKRFSYQQGRMAIKFAEFLKKVYSDINVDIKVSFEPKYDIDRQIMTMFITDAIYQSFEYDGLKVFGEVSSERMLNSNEVIRILKMVKDMTGRIVEIDQFECETCRSQDPEAPYHILMEEVKEDARQKDGTSA